MKEIPNHILDHLYCMDKRFLFILPHDGIPRPSGRCLHLEVFLTNRVIFLHSDSV